VSESFASSSPQDTPNVVVEAEVHDALPVLAGEAHAMPARSADGGLPGDRRAPGKVMPAVQAVAVAAGGFAACAAVVGLVHHRQQRSTALGKRRRAGRSIGHGSSRGAARAVELVQIVGSRSLLVDVHLLGGSSDR
jgi:hypothetical protein